MRARANFLSMILTISLVAVPAGSYAEEVETEISSDTLEYQRESGTYVLKGNVSIKKGDMNVSADESEFNENTSEATLRG
ncbi:MAG: hypothetical protein JSV21_02090, partial [Nitrospirota bacterium]